jgi:hypothetical protein
MAQKMLPHVLQFANNTHPSGTRNMVVSIACKISTLHIKEVQYLDEFTCVQPADFAAAVRELSVPELVRR